ncbi:hypothetical protein NDU88_003418 [Pleurodeles waltl]|uniref:Uncharacterized protein n=1 Tax=Pleurodeles waltl TaxID=8319 RepID=A0AAV7NJA9_PLEWA|nr:hypothetical protein NDU88_003418 [Pleurodeles waltl]
MKVSGRYGRGCLSVAAAPGAASDGLVRPGAGLDPRGRRRIAAVIPDWTVCCAQRRIRTRAHPEGGSADRSVWWGHLPVASRPPARGAEPGASWLRDCIQRGDTETGGPPGLPGEESALGTPPWGTHNRSASACCPGTPGYRRRDSLHPGRPGTSIDCPLWGGAVWSRPAPSAIVYQSWGPARRTHDRLVREGSPADPGLSAWDRAILYRETDAVIRANVRGRWDLIAAPARTLGGTGLRNVGGDP